MTVDGISAVVKLDSLELGKGKHGESRYDTAKMEFYGALIAKAGQKFLDEGIDTRAGVGSQMFFSIEFEDYSSVSMEPDGCIGRMEVYLSGSNAIPDPNRSPENPVIFSLSINLPRADLTDLLAISPRPIKIDPVFHRDGDGKLTTVKTGDTIQFNVCRVHFSLILENQP